MMPDIFSTFDPHISSTLLPIKSVFLLLTPMLIAIMLASLFTSNSRLLAIFMSTMDVMYSQLARTLSSSLKGITFIVSSTFMLIISLNLMGLVPYCFSLSSHLIMTLSLGIPLWLSLIISSLMFKPKATTAHFLPDGAPDWLNPFLVLIESSSVLVRPLTLSFRLAANMTAGHIVLSLLGIYMSAALFTSTLSSFILLLTSSFYILFEIAICMIQAYIFCLLVSLYSDDHAH